MNFDKFRKHLFYRTSSLTASEFTNGKDHLSPGSHQHLHWKKSATSTDFALVYLHNKSEIAMIPANIYLSKIKKQTLVKGIKYVQS